MRELKIGMIGLDTSHATAFTKLLNDAITPFHVKGGKVLYAYPIMSPDFELSYSRIEQITKEVASFGVEIVSSIEEVAEKGDAILLESVDGRVHLAQLEKLILYQKPIFIDKPLCLSSKEANQMYRLSITYNTPIMSSSALRFAEDLIRVLSMKDKGTIIGADCFGPMEMIDVLPGYFWYGIHTIEMLYAIFGKGAKTVRSFHRDDSDLIVTEWSDGKIGTIRGNRKGNHQFAAVIHFEKGSEFVSIDSNEKPFYASLLEEVIRFFETGIGPFSFSETVEIIRFIEAANESRATGKIVEI